MFRKTLSLILAITMLVGPTGVWGQSGGVRMEAAGQTRDAIADPNSGLLWVAVYDADEIWAIVPGTGERVQRINVGNGPVALAQSADLQTLAVAHSLDNTLSFIDLAAGKVTNTFPVGQAPADVLALPDNSFLVANSLSGTLTRVQPDGNTTELADAGMAPSSLILSGNTIAITSKSEREVRFLAADTLQPSGTITLPEIPRSIAALGDGHFVASGTTGVQVIDGTRSAIAAAAPVAAKSVTASNGEILALLDDSMLVMDEDLRELRRTSLLEPADQLTATWGLYVALAPRARSLTVYGEQDAPQAQPAAEMPSSVPANDLAPEPIDTAVVGDHLEVADAQDVAVETDLEPENTVVPDAEDVPGVEPGPLSEVIEEPGAPQDLTPADDARPAIEVETEPVELEPAAAATDTPDAPAAEPAPPGGWRANPMNLRTVRAPKIGVRTSASPLEGENDLTILDALARPTEFAAPEFGFVMPDWQEPFRDIQADKMNQDLTSDNLSLEGNVKLRMGDMLFESDAFDYYEAEGLIHASGNVNLTQMQSRITASAFDYHLRDPQELPPPTLLDANLDEQQRAKQRLTLGRIKADNIHIDEPTRELIAEYLEYDMLTNEGELINARGKAGIYYFSADRLVITGPNSFYGEEVWITTCECSEDDPPPYRLRMRDVQIIDGELVNAHHARLQIKNFNTPLYFPLWTRGKNAIYPWTVDFDSGRRAETGYFLNVGQQYQITPDYYIGPRVYLTEKEGVGLGFDANYDLMETPSSRLFRSKGSINTLATTKGREYVHWYHRYEQSKDLVLRAQVEHWGDEDFYSDFYYDKFRNRTTPRTFANVTYRQPGYIATGTARANTHGWVRETERLPEGTFHLLERPIGNGFYLAYDNVTGYNEREPRGTSAARTINIARLTYDLDLHDAFSITPFAEVEASWYSRERHNDSALTRLATNFGVTAQTRFHKVYPGILGFSSIKHLVVPSITYSYRPKTNVDIYDTPVFDSWDNVTGQSRIETKLANVFFGKDAETGETWQLGRITLYQGNDLWNEQRLTEDYEVEIDIRPRPWWGFQMVAERHVEKDDLGINDQNFLRQWTLNRLEEWFGVRPDNELYYDFNGGSGDYNRLLTQLYYDNTSRGGKWSTRLGYAYTETQSRVFNREVVYGAGYRISDRWSLAFEHRYDFEDNSLRSQEYEVRRIWDCWESAVRFRDRESGFDVDVEFSITAFPGTRLKL